MQKLGKFDIPCLVVYNASELQYNVYIYNGEGIRISIIYKKSEKHFFSSILNMLDVGSKLMYCQRRPDLDPMEDSLIKNVFVKNEDQTWTWYVAYMYERKFDAFRCSRRCVQNVDQVVDLLNNFPTVQDG